jgi:hypothetical protein
LPRLQKDLWDWCLNSGTLSISSIGQIELRRSFDDVKMPIKPGLAQDPLCCPQIAANDNGLAWPSFHFRKAGMALEPIMSAPAKGSALGFLFLAREPILGLHTKPTNNSLEAPGLRRCFFYFQRILSPVGRRILPGGLFVRWRYGLEAGSRRTNCEHDGVCKGHKA